MVLVPRGKIESKGTKISIELTMENRFGVRYDEMERRDAEKKHTQLWYFT